MMRGSFFFEVLLENLITDSAPRTLALPCDNVGPSPNPSTFNVPTTFDRPRLEATKAFATKRAPFGAL
jgi:hypothetical protein